MRRDYKFKFWIRLERNSTFNWYKLVKFRGANCMDVYLLGLKLNFGLPYKHNFIYEEGYNAGFRGD